MAFHIKGKIYIWRSLSALLQFAAADMVWLCSLSVYYTCISLKFLLFNLSPAGCCWWHQETFRIPFTQKGNLEASQLLQFGIYLHSHWCNTWSPLPDHYSGRYQVRFGISNTVYQIVTFSPSVFLAVRGCQTPWSNKLSSHLLDLGFALAAQALRASFSII